MPYISDASLARLEDKVARLQDAGTRVKAHVLAKKQDAIAAAEIIGGAAAVGFLRGKMEKEDGTFNVPGTSLDIQLTLGVLGVLASLGGFLKQYDTDLMNVSSGILASWSAQVAEKYGKTGQFTLVGQDGAPSLLSSIP